VELKIDPSVVLATRKYVDDELAKLDHKNSVRVATTAAIVLSGTQTIDGIALIAGDRVLVKNQAAGAANGIYVVATGAWSRAVDADASIEVTPGMLVPVEQGTANADSVWQLATDGVIVLGTTALAFEASAGPSGVSAGSYRSVTVDKRGRVTGGTNPTTLAGYGLTDAAPLASPALTGTPTAPTAVQATNNTQLATTAFVKAALAALVDSSPLTLDTLNELAAALGDDPNFAATITTLLGLKAPLASPNFTGDPTAPTPPPLDNDTSLATTAFVKRSGLTYAAIESILGNRLMAAADAGKIFVIGAPATITLPLASSLPQATTITFFYYSAPNVPTFVRSGADLFATGGGALSAYTPKSTGYITFINEAADTWEISGSGALDQLSGFAATLSTAGSQRLPSGLIRKWGLFTVPANVSSAPVDVTFPLAFPNACLNLKAGIGIQISDYDTPVNYRSNRQEISLGLGTTTGFEGQAFIDNNLGHTRIVQWEAIGY
ncbi:gp53-like domain-containing protein, partial [Devosia sp.]|uniref:gp53-like domain-containing protein n=1 Tax=Devosia sp. TaxID=1871048 RepID=UPI003FA5E98D